MEQSFTIRTLNGISYCVNSAGYINLSNLVGEYDINEITESIIWKKFISTIKESYTFDLLTQEIKQRRGGSETITDKMLFMTIDTYTSPLEFVHGLYAHPMFESLFHIFMSIYSSINKHKIDVAIQTETNESTNDEEISFIKDIIKCGQFKQNEITELFNRKFKTSYTPSSFKIKFSNLLTSVYRLIEDTQTQLFELQDTEEKINTIKTFIHHHNDKIDKTQTRTDRIMQLCVLCNNHFHRFDKYKTFMRMCEAYDIIL